MIKECKMRHENGNCLPAGGFCTANTNICEALQNAYSHGYFEGIQKGFEKGGEQKWIPVTAGFPEEKTDVLVCNDDGKMGVAFIEMVEWLPNYISPEWRIKYCLYDSDSWDQDENGEITAWMELPEPYRGEEC